MFKLKTLLIVIVLLALIFTLWRQAPNCVSCEGSCCDGQGPCFPGCRRCYPCFEARR
jgi:hypothetical protein